MEDLPPAPLPPVSGLVVSKAEPPAVSSTEPPVPAQELPTPIPTPMAPAAEVPVPVRKGIPWKVLGGVAGLIVLVLAAAFVLFPLR